MLDTETTGLNDDDEIIEISLIDLKGRVKLDSLVQCQHETIPAGAARVHGITKDMLSEAPTFPELWRQLKPLLASYELLIYNAEYDEKMLHQTAKRYKLEMPKLVTHCLMLQYSAYVGEESYRGGYKYQSLASACSDLKIKQNGAHRALGDAQMALEILKKLAEFTTKGT